MAMDNQDTEVLCVHCVSTLLEILGDVLQYSGNNITMSPHLQFQPFLRFWVVGSRAAVTAVTHGVFQPFLRFWRFFKPNTLLMVSSVSFQPFLRFWARCLRRILHRWRWGDVSTLLEILACEQASVSADNNPESFNPS